MEQERLDARASDQPAFGSLLSTGLLAFAITSYKHAGAWAMHFICFLYASCSMLQVKFTSDNDLYHLKMFNQDTSHFISMNPGSRIILTFNNDNMIWNFIRAIWSFFL